MRPLHWARRSKKDQRASADAAADAAADEGRHANEETCTPRAAKEADRGSAAEEADASQLKRPTRRGRLTGRAAADGADAPLQTRREERGGMLARAAATTKTNKSRAELTRNEAMALALAMAMAARKPIRQK